MKWCSKTSHNDLRLPLTTVTIRSRLTQETIASEPIVRTISGAHAQVIMFLLHFLRPRVERGFTFCRNMFNKVQPATFFTSDDSHNKKDKRCVMAFDRTIRYFHRFNADGSHDSICPVCYRTIASTTVEESLVVGEASHICKAEHLTILRTTLQDYPEQLTSPRANRIQA
jgi:hypothetical protein